LTEAWRVGFWPVRNIRSIYIKDMSAAIMDDEIVRFRITAKLSFELDGQSPD
jgi:hypothetical protein